jgi:histidinol-phosphate aminotransferase
VHGLCGLRVGFALCGSEELPRALDQVRQPFFCNALAQAAAVEALAHQDAVIDRVALTIAERNSMEEGLRALGIDAAQSQANFCWLHLGEDRDEAEVMRGLRERGVLVRGGGALGSETPALRVTYGLPEENRRFLQALAEVLQAAAVS